MDSSSSISDGKRGGWTTFPFITATMAGLTLASMGWSGNLIVYLIDEFNVKSIDAAQTYNIVNGCITLFPILGAIIADSFLGCFSVIWISSLISLLGIVLFVLTATLDPLRPPHCQDGPSLCVTSTNFQFAILYVAIALSTLGAGGSRFTIATMGADQFDKPKHQASSFSWFVFTMYISTTVSGMAIVYVQDDVSWGLGFGLCAVANVVGLIVFLLGNRFYRHVKPKGSAFMELVRVPVAALWKRSSLLSMKNEDYYQNPDSASLKVTSMPTKTFKFLNRAALITEGDVRSDGTITNKWKLSNVQQVENLKTIMKLFPLWSTGIFLSTPLAIQGSLSILQAITMDRHIGPNFKIPPGTMFVFVLVSTCITILIIDRFLYPTWHKLVGRFPPPLQRIGIGHVLCVLSMGVSALVEYKRLEMAKDRNLQDQTGDVIIPMSVFWLVPQLALAGIGDAFHFPGNTALYYQEFPETLKSTSTGVVALFIAVAYYLSTALVGLVRRVTGWLPDNINHGRMDNVYWLLFVIGVINFGYYLVCAWLYKYQGVEEMEDNDSTPGS